MLKAIKGVIDQVTSVMLVDTWHPIHPGTLSVLVSGYDEDDEDSVEVALKFHSRIADEWMVVRASAVAAFAHPYHG